MGKQTVSALSDHLGYWLRLVSNQVSTSFARRLADKDVTVAEWVVLRHLAEEDGIVPNKLANKLQLTRGAISKLAERLISKGLVKRTDCTADGRMHVLTLRTKGRRLVPLLAALADENDREFFDLLDANERAALQQVLEKLASRHGIRTVPID